MKALLWLPLLALSAFADEAADRTSIGQLVASATSFLQNAPAFTADADGRAVIGDLVQGLQPPPTVTISHEPFGEATLNIPSLGAGMQNARVVSTGIRFIAADVALVDATFTYNGRGATPLLFVAKREDGVWKIASLRVVARASSTTP